jgi:DNA mismatch repair protein MutS
LLKESDLTPMYRQWAQAKRDYPEVLLLFRMGDFYEMFGEDAEVGSRVLGLTLTARKYAGDKKIPMCGVPYHALDRYLRQLVQQGYRAAICDQTEDPKQAKGLVQRAVTRVVTPGTILEDELLAGNEHNFLVSVVTRGPVTGLAAVDASTGDFLVTEVRHRAGIRLEGPASAGPPLARPAPFDGEREGPASAGPRPAANDGPAEAGPSTGATAVPLPAFQPEASPLSPVLDEIARLRPAEILLSDAEDPLHEVLQTAKLAPLTLATAEAPAFQSPAEELCEHFSVASLRGFGCEDLPAAQAAAAQALRYLRSTHLQASPGSPD